MKPVIIIAIVVAGGLGIFGMAIATDVNSADQLQFFNFEEPDVDLLTLSFDANLAVCNPTSMPTSFDRIDSVIYYKDREIGTYSISGNTFQPYVAKDIQSRFNLNGQNTLQILLGGALAGLMGQDVSVDQNELKIVATVEKKLAGIIPTTTKFTMSPSQGQGKFLTPDTINEWKCDWTPRMKEVASKYGIDTSVSFQEFLEYRESLKP